MPRLVAPVATSIASSRPGMPLCAKKIGFQATGIVTGNNSATAIIIQTPKSSCCGTRPLIAHLNTPKIQIKQPIFHD